MQIAEFSLERWFAQYEPDAEIMLAESGIRSLPADRFELDVGDLGYVIPTNGEPVVRGMIADRYGLSAANVVCTTGTQEANFLVFLTLLEPDDHVVCVTPTYQALHAIPEALASVTRVSLEPPDWTLPVDAVADAIQPDTGLIVLNNPNNPTGQYHPSAAVEACYDLAADNDAYLLCDEVYRLLADDPQKPVAAMGPAGLSTSGLTKAYGLAGARFGWLAGETAVVDAVWQWKDYTTISPSQFGQHLAMQALGPQEAAILAENRRLARRNRERVSAFLADHGLDWHHPVGVNGFITIPEGFSDSRAFCRQVVDAESVVLAPGAAFGFDDRFRLGFGLAPADLERGLERLGGFLDRHH